MAHNYYTGYGRIISVTPGETKSDKGGTYLRVSVNVPTGGKKKDDDEYAPSNIISVTLFDNYAKALEPYVAVGNYAIVSGPLDVISTYETDSGETRLNIRLLSGMNTQLTLVGERTAAIPTSKTESTKKSGKANKQAVFEEDDEDFGF